MKTRDDLLNKELIKKDELIKALQDQVSLVERNEDGSAKHSDPNGSKDESQNGVLNREQIEIENQEKYKSLQDSLVF